MTTTDTCPNCVRRGIAPVAESHRDGCTVYGYRCPSCRHQWATTRDADAYRYGRAA